MGRNDMVHLRKYNAIHPVFFPTADRARQRSRRRLIDLVFGTFDGHGPHLRLRIQRNQHPSDQCRMIGSNLGGPEGCKRAGVQSGLRHGTICVAHRAAKGIEVFPDDFALLGHFKKASVRSGTHHGVAVVDSVGARDEWREE